LGSCIVTSSKSQQHYRAVRCAVAFAYHVTQHNCTSLLTDDSNCCNPVLCILCQACCAKAQCQWALATAYTCSGGATVFKVDCCTDAMQADGPSLQSAPVLCTGTSYLSRGIGSMSPFRAEVRQLHTEPLQLLLLQFRQLQSEPAAALL
jgi:hypothetical protein